MNYIDTISSLNRNVADFQQHGADKNRENQCSLFAPSRGML